MSGNVIDIIERFQTRHAPQEEQEMKNFNASRNGAPTQGVLDKNAMPRPPQSQEAEFDLLCQLRPRPGKPPLDEIERKLDHMLEELRTPTAIGYSARRGNRPRND
jgi:hypothetical protein